MKVREARGRSDLSRFVGLPWKLYRDDRVWVPPLRASVRAMLDQDKHPFYDGGDGAEIELFLAWDGHDVVGRVAAILYQGHNRVHDENICFFGFFESIERPDVARELLAAVERWAVRVGVPTSFLDNALWLLCARMGLYLDNAAPRTLGAGADS